MTVTAALRRRLASACLHREYMRARALSCRKVSKHRQSLPRPLCHIAGGRVSSKAEIRARAATLQDARVTQAYRVPSG